MEIQADNQVVGTIVRHKRRNARDILGRRILNVKGPQVIPVAKQLERGDELCRERRIPMSPQLIKKVTQIYNNCDAQRSSRSDDTPLMEALKLGLMDIAWGFIECAKQTNSNLLTNETGDVAFQQFLWPSNRVNERTAFDVAFERNQVEVASLLLEVAPLKCLKSQLKRRGKTLIPLLKNYPTYDGIIFGMLKKEKRGELTSHQIVDISPRQESIIEMESITELMDRCLQPEPEGNKIQEAVLRDLDHSLLELELNPKNTILHFVSKFGHVESVEEILKKDLSMISCRNSKGETPAYVAAKEGHANILQLMFQYIKGESMDIESIVTRRIDKHNALHIAIQNHHVEVVFLLIEQLPQLANRVNDYNESPIYLAAERKYSSVLE